ncbi:MAG: hypothetical protein ACTSRZ_03850 [Promethearchaeota archaeon]
MGSKSVDLKYIWGIISAIIGGISNFSGQLLQKKAINSLSEQTRESQLMKNLIKTPSWIVGIILNVALSGIFIIIAQILVGAALVPGLTSSGFIILAIGAAKILKENMKWNEYVAMILLVFAIIMISLSELSIHGTIDNFYNADFSISIAIWTVIFFALWFGCRYIGKKLKKQQSIFFALAAGFPFVLANLWMQPMINSIKALGNVPFDYTILVIFLASAGIELISSILGIVHFQFALNSGNASIVVPIQQAPQQFAPIIIFYLIYKLNSPHPLSLPFIISGMILIIIAGSILAKRQAELQKITSKKSN